MTASGSPTQGAQEASQEKAQAGSKPRVRDRLVEAASDLFYQQGINCVGIDAIVCEAGTNKMSLYRNFASKDELVVQYLKEREKETFARWEEVTAAHPDDPRAQLVALFEHIVEIGHEKAHCGCPSANAAVELRGTEHPALEVIYAGREKVRGYVSDRLRAAGARDPETLTDGLMLLLEGALMSRLTFREKQWPANSMVANMKALLDAELGPAAAD